MQNIITIATKTIRINGRNMIVALYVEPLSLFLSVFNNRVFPNLILWNLQNLENIFL